MLQFTKRRFAQMRQVLIQGLNNQNVGVNGESRLNELLHCTDNNSLTFQQFGSNAKCCFNVVGTNLYLSYRDASGATKLYDTPSYFEITDKADGWSSIKSVETEQYMWLNGNEPYITKYGTEDHLWKLVNKNI